MNTLHILYFVSNYCYCNKDEFHTCNVVLVNIVATHLLDREIANILCLGRNGMQ